MAEIQVVVLVAQERERVVDRDGAQRGIDLVALDLGVVEVVEDAPALVRLLGVSRVERLVFVHGLAGDPVQVAVEGREAPRLELVPGHHDPPFGLSTWLIGPPFVCRGLTAIGHRGPVASPGSLASLPGYARRGRRRVQRGAPLNCGSAAGAHSSKNRSCSGPICWTNSSSTPASAYA